MCNHAVVETVHLAQALLVSGFGSTMALPVLRSINGGSSRSSDKPRSSRDSCSRSRPTCCRYSKTRTWTVAKQPSNRAPKPRRPPTRTHHHNQKALELRRPGSVRSPVWKKLPKARYLLLTSKAPPLTLSQSER